MKATKHGTKYKITYRCPNYPKPINEYFDSEEEANLRIAQIQLEKKRGTLTPPAHLLDPDRDHALYRERITVAQLMKEYVDLYGLSHWSEGTLSCNQHRIDDYIVPYIGDVPIKALTTHMLEHFYQKLRTQPAVKMKGREHENETISISVVEKVHALIRSALNQAIRWDYLSGANPAMAVELPRHQSQPREVWSDQEAQRALQVCTDPFLKLCMYLALGCSMRIGEILGLTWDCVHYDDASIQSGTAYLTVNKELRRCSKKCIEDLKRHGRSDIFFAFPALKQTESTTVLVLKTPKTTSSVRNIYLPKTVTYALMDMRRYQERMKRDLGPEYQDFNIVVAQDNGRPFEERLIAAKLRELIAENNLKPVVFHSLRHTFATMALQNGVDIKTVSNMLGHYDAGFTLRTYTHATRQKQDDAAQTMGSFMERVR